MNKICLEKDCNHIVLKGSDYCTFHNKVCVKCNKRFSNRIHGNLCLSCKKEQYEYNKHFKLCKQCNKIEYFSTSRKIVCDKCENEIKKELEYNKHNMECSCCKSISFFTTNGIRIKNTLNFRPSKKQQYCDKCIINGVNDNKDFQIITDITYKFSNALYNIIIKDYFFKVYISSKKYNNWLTFIKTRDSNINNNKFRKFIQSLASELAIHVYNLKNWDNKYIDIIVKDFIKGINRQTGYCLTDFSKSIELDKFKVINLYNSFTNWYSDMPKNIAKMVLDTLFFFKVISTEGAGEFLIKMFSQNIVKVENLAGDIHYNNGKCGEVKSMISEGKAGRLLHNRDNHFSVRNEKDKEFVINKILSSNFYLNLSQENRDIIQDQFRYSSLQDYVFYISNEKHSYGIYKMLYDICKIEVPSKLNYLIDLIFRNFCYKDYKGKLLLSDIDLINEDNLYIYGLINSIYIYLNEIKNDQLILVAPDEIILINKDYLENYTLEDCKKLLSYVTPVFPTTELTLENVANDRNKNRGFAVMRK